MKVLSLLEPWASLIYEKKKWVETRSWKTSYRGKIYIHASLTPIDSTCTETKRLLNLLKDPTMKYGYIIAKCDLVDCRYMDEEFLNTISKNAQEYMCGEYAIGRYAWILENIEVISPIPAMGQLNLWNYYTEEEIMEQMNRIQYGWIGKNSERYTFFNNQNSQEYRLQSPKELLLHKIGVCWDQVELERFYFRPLKLEVKTYFLCYYGNENCPSHTFLTYQKNSKYYWFEHSWEKYCGIYEYSSLKDLFNDVRSKFINDIVTSPFDSDHLVLREYCKPSYHISCSEFYRHCESFDFIDVDSM